MIALLETCAVALLLILAVWGIIELCCLACRVAARRVRTMAEQTLDQVLPPRSQPHSQDTHEQ